jgi:hypothetical protein
MYTGLAAFQPANFVGVFSSRVAMNGNMPYQPAIQEVLPARKGSSPTGLFTETATSVRASRRVASGIATLRVNKIQIPRPAQLIQTLILTIFYTRRQTLNPVKQFIRGNSGSLKKVNSQACDLSACRV